MRYFNRCTVINFSLLLFLLLFLFQFLFLPVFASEECCSTLPQMEIKKDIPGMEKVNSSTSEAFFPSNNLFVNEGHAEFNRIIFKFIFAFVVIIVIAFSLRYYLRNRGYIPVSESSLKIVDRIVLNQDVELFIVDYDKKENFYIAHCKNGSIINFRSTKLEKTSFDEQLTEATLSENKINKIIDKEK